MTCFTTVSSAALTNYANAPRIGQVHARSAERILELCRKAGGVYVKAGQLASETSALPMEYRTILAALQHANSLLTNVDAKRNDDDDATVATNQMMPTSMWMLLGDYIASYRSHVIYARHYTD
eukprot:1726340-Pyramimonas_sp.AAC.1